MNRPGDAASVSVGTKLGNMDDVSFTGDFEGKVSHQGMCKGSGNGCIRRGPVEEPGGVGLGRSFAGNFDS